MMLVIPVHRDHAAAFRALLYTVVKCRFQSAAFSAVLRMSQQRHARKAGNSLKNRRIRLTAAVIYDNDVPKSFFN